MAQWIIENLARGARCAWIGPYHKSVEIGWEHIVNGVKSLERAGLCKIDNGNTSLTMANGAKLLTFSGENPEGVYGQAFNAIVVDEATRMREAVATAVRSTVSATGGWVRYAFNTDRGFQHWVIRDFLRAKAGTEPSTGFITMPTYDSPYVPFEDVEQARRTLPDRVFRAMYMAEVQVDGAGVFRNVRECHAGQPEIPTGDDYVIGVDLAKTFDFTVCIVINQRTRHVAWIERFHNAPWHVQRTRIKELSRRYGHAICVVDATGVGDPNVEELQRAGVSVHPYVFSNASKRDAIEKLVVGIEQKQLTFPATGYGQPGQGDFETLTNELEQYEFRITPGGSVGYSAPDGMHDDCVIALALAWLECTAGHRIDLDTFKPAFGETEFNGTPLF